MHTRTIEPLVVHNVVERAKLLILHFLELLVDVIIPALMTVEGTPCAWGWMASVWLVDEEAAPAAVEGTHRSPIPAAPMPPFSSSSATSSRVSNDAATEATGERREEESLSLCKLTNLPRRAANASWCSWKDSCLSVHECRVLCCYSGTLLSLEIYSVFTFTGF